MAKDFCARFFEDQIGVVTGDANRNRLILDQGRLIRMQANSIFVPVVVPFMHIKFGGHPGI